MQQYRVLLVVAAVALFGAGALIAKAFTHVPPPAPPPVAAPVVETVPSRSVLVARVDLPAGRFLQESDFDWHDRPANTLRPDLYVQGADTTQPLIGAVLLRPLHAGEAIERAAVVSPRDRGFLSAVLPPGKRSISIGVDEVTGDAGLIFPGDHVDIILTHSNGPETGRPGGPAFGAPGGNLQVLGQMVLENVRILAVDQAMRGPSDEKPPEGDKGPERLVGLGGGGANQSRQQHPGAARTVTLEVTPREAEMVAVAGTLGKLTLALRGLDRSGSADAAESGVRPGPIRTADILRDLAEPARPARERDVQPAPASSTGVVLIRGGAQK